MVSKREKAPSLRMRKVALVICEGETEENYMHLLRQWYKSPIKIVSHIEGTKITPLLVKSRIREISISAKDDIKAFLMYDMDVPAINEKLRKCEAALLLGNPCFELWLLLHVKEQKRMIDTEGAMKELTSSANLWKGYDKAAFTEPQKTFLKKHTEFAIERTKSLTEFKNPSTGIYKLVETLKATAQSGGF